MFCEKSSAGGGAVISCLSCLSEKCVSRRDLRNAERSGRAVSRGCNGAFIYLRGKVSFLSLRVDLGPSLPATAKKQ